MATTVCEQCREPMPLLARRHAKTCSPKCRKRASRARQRAERPPAEMRGLVRWVRRGENKRPLRADNGRTASSTAPSTWATYEDAVRSPHGSGIGFVLNGDGIVCIDLDHCLVGDEVATWAQDILDRCPPTYIEVSPGGDGLHIWGRGRVVPGRRIRRGDGAHIEIYGQGRYIALGRRYRDAPPKLADLTSVLATLR